MTSQLRRAAGLDSGGEIWRCASLLETWRLRLTMCSRRRRTTPTRDPGPCPPSGSFDQLCRQHDPEHWGCQSA